MAQVTILGINGHIGHAAATAFAEAGWQVVGFGRSNKRPTPGVRFIKGDATKVADIRAAIADSDIVVNALNLPYHQWDKGRMEAQVATVIEALAGSGKTMIFPGNIYNYAADARVLTPDLEQRPATPRGAIRVRVEQMIRAAAEAGQLQAIILRAGDFFGPDCDGDWFDQAILRDVGKGRGAILGTRGVGHAWAFLPDVARAMVVLAGRRAQFGAFDTFHFAGNFVTPETMTEAIAAAAPVPLKFSPFPWLALTLIGVANPLLREVAKMGYLWQKPLALKDERLDKILGQNFGTAFDEAVAQTLTRFFGDKREAA